MATVGEAATNRDELRRMWDAVNALILQATSIEDRVPGFLDDLFTTAEQQGTVTVRNKIQAEIDRIEALDVTGL